MGLKAYGHALDGIGKMALPGYMPREWKYDRGRLILALQKSNKVDLGMDALVSAGLFSEYVTVGDSGAFTF